MDDKEAKKAAAKAKQRQLLYEARINRAVTETMATPDGRLLFWHLLELTGYGNNPHTGNALNTSFKCGELNVGLRIVALLGAADPANFVRMQAERLNDELSGQPASPDRPDADPGADSFAGTDTEPESYA